jgi:enoyl-CoA hydratase
MSYDTIRLERDGPITTIRLHRPERMNAVTEAMYEELEDALEAARGDTGVRCLILTGSVLRRDGVDKQAFCAGADLKQHSAGTRGLDDRRRYVELAHETARRIREFPRPVLAAVNGPARGAGAELALCCDLMLVAEQATLAFPEIGLGTFVGSGLTHVLPRLVGLARAKELLYTGRVIDGPTAVELGLALECHPVDELGARAHALATEIAAGAPRSLALAKAALQASVEDGFGAALARETEAILECMETEDWKEGLRAFTERRGPRFTGR